MAHDYDGQDDDKYDDKYNTDEDPDKISGKALETASACGELTGVTPQ